MTGIPVWRAGFELEVILGGLGEPRLEQELREHGPMDLASPAYCRFVAARLRELTGRRWTALAKPPRRPGFYVVPEYGLDPLHWPRDRLAGVELLTPPLPLNDADAVRSELIDAIYELDDDFNFIPSEFTEDCGWHINIDAGEQRLDPDRFIVGVDELAILSRNDRLFSRYTGTQRHAVGITLLRHLAHDSSGKFLAGSALDNVLLDRAGRDKGYAANFSKLLNGYLELRHFSADSFFNGASLNEQIEPITLALELWPSQSAPLDRAFRRKFDLLAHWLKRHRKKLSWELHPGCTVAEGRVHFAGSPLGSLVANGFVEVNLFGREEYDYVATIRDIELPDIAEAVALLALDLAELHNLNASRSLCANKPFHSAMLKLAADLRKDAELSSAAQTKFLLDARARRREVGR